jgi:hypothetical protein
VKRRAEAARRGEALPAPPPDSSEQSGHAALGQRTPDFVVTNLLTRESVRLQKWLGRPIVMLFYIPDSRTAERALRYCQSLQDAHPDEVCVLAFAISDDVELVRKQHTQLGLSIPVLSGKGLRQNYEVEATPKLIVIDSAGLVRGSYVGWGPEAAPAVSEELKRCLAGKSQNKGRPAPDAAPNSGTGPNP